MSARSDFRALTAAAGTTWTEMPAPDYNPDGAWLRLFECGHVAPLEAVAALRRGESVSCGECAALDAWINGMGAQ